MNLRRLCFLAIVLLAGLYIPAVIASDDDSHLPGVWVRNAPNQIGWQEGLVFEQDHKFGLVGIYSMMGSGWKLDGKTLSISTVTDRLPDPEWDQFELVRLSDTELVLKSSPLGNYLDGTYRRDDNAASTLDVTVAYREKIALSEGAVLVLDLHQNADSKEPALLAHQVVPLRGKQVPVQGTLYYQTAKLDAAGNVTLSATIMDMQKAMFHGEMALSASTINQSSQLTLTLTRSNP